jgi:hypothetical protein
MHGTDINSLFPGFKSDTLVGKSCDAKHDQQDREICILSHRNPPVFIFS